MVGEFLSGDENVVLGFYSVSSEDSFELQSFSSTNSEIQSRFSLSLTIA